jgi:hemerythrin-like domain-containing protein
MKPIGPLMREHRLIEQMINLLDKKMLHLGQEEQSIPDFTGMAVDFFRTYADRTHHGKEEDILFVHLAKKKLSPELKKIMDELVQEHIQARKMVGQLADAGKSYQQGDIDAFNSIKTLISKLLFFYPVHVEKEDKHFFYPILEYFTKEEQDTMLQEFWEFDRNMIHEKYRKVVEGLES